MPLDLATNAARRKRLRDTLRGGPESHSTAYDAVVTLNEVNNGHGTGVLIQRIYPDDSQVLSIRAASHYGGEQTFGHMQVAVPDGCSSRGDIYRWVLDFTAGLDIQRILCVPFEEAELLVALALRDALQAPLALYIMDDHNVRAAGISDGLMGEVIEKASIRFAISSDMRDAYESKYRRRFWIAPPTVSPAVSPWHRRDARRGSAVIIGNIWGRSWLAELRRTVREAGIEVDWYANSPKGGWLNLAPDDLLRDGIRLQGPVQESDLPELLSRYEVALHPNGPEGGRGENAGVAALSLPTRIPLILCASDLPVIVLGDTSTCAARFVSYFGAGVACRYDSHALGEALDAVRAADWRKLQADSLARLRSIFKTADIGSWMSSAIDAGRPPTLTFESLSVTPPLVVPRFLPDASTLGPWLADFEPVVASMKLLSRSGFRPDFVVDVGASTGVWSQVVASVFPSAHYVLIEPLLDRYLGTDGKHANGFHRSTLVQAAISSETGTATFHVSSNLYGSSLIAEALDVHESRQEVVVPVTTLNAIAGEAGLSGHGILKLDIQGGEMEALDGAGELMPSIDVLVVEVTCDPTSPDVPSFTQMHQAIEALGFVYFDDVGEWRDPRIGVLLQKDVMYVRRPSAIAALRHAG